MSLDVYLVVKEPVPHQGSGIFVRRNGATVEITREEWDEINPGHEPCIADSSVESYCVFDSNITHNLAEMADEAGIYKALWRPEEVGITHAHQLIEPLTGGLALLETNREEYEKYNPPNGWGNYDGLVTFTRQYLEAAKENPDAEVRVSR